MLLIERLDGRRHDRAGFTCGELVLDHICASKPPNIIVTGSPPPTYW